MKFRLEQQLCKDTESYERNVVDKYAEFLEEEGRILRIGNLLFDVEAMLRPFVCDSRLCIPDSDGKIQGKCRKTDSCCSVYTPRLSSDERNRIEELLPGLRQRFPELNVALSEKGGYFEWDDGYDRMLLKDASENFCIFLTSSEEDLGFRGCMIHAWCLENGLSPMHYKPSACGMFPLYLMDLSENDEILVTAHGKKSVTLGDADAPYYKIGCQKRCPSDTPPLYVSMKGTLEHMFGAEAWRLLDKGLKQREQDSARGKSPGR
jgi:hypothetical protein